MKRVASSVIMKIKARQILDSRGVPTVQVDLFTNKGFYRASVPSADVSPAVPLAVHEVVELRDHDSDKYFGNGVSKAVAIINNKISEALIGMDPQQQSQIDQALIDLDKTDNKATKTTLSLASYFMLLLSHSKYAFYIIISAMN
jgi:enolase